MAIDSVSIDRLCQRGSRETVSAALEKIGDIGERAEFYRLAVKATHHWRPALARFLCEAYIEEFYQEPEPFGPGILPNAEILEVLVRSYEQSGAFQLAEWVCEIAVANHLESSAVPGGFTAWVERIRQKREAAVS